MKETTTTSNSSNIYSESSVASGWLCPRCGRINAPWVRQCDCSRNNWTITYDDLVYKNDKWWKDYVTSTNVNQVVGGSDYKDSATGNWVNVPKTYTNSVKR